MAVCAIYLRRCVNISEVQFTALIIEYCDSCMDNAPILVAKMFD